MVYYAFRAPLNEFSGHALMAQFRGDLMEIATLATFRDRFHTLSRGVFKGLYTKGLVFAGGFVTACLTTDINHAGAYSASDIDIFLVANSVRTAQSTTRTLENVLRTNIPAFDTNFRIMRTPGVISIIPSPAYVSQGYRKIQIVMTLYSSPSDVVAHFDLDPVAALYNLEDVYIAPRAVRSFWTAYTFVTDAIRGSTAQRILKYALRGFSLMLPDVSIHDEADGSVTPLADMLAAQQAGQVRWTHRATDVARLAAMWDIVFDKPDLVETLIKATRGQNSLYGLYDEAENQFALPGTAYVDTEFDLFVDGFLLAGFLTHDIVAKKIADVETYANNAIMEAATITNAFRVGNELTMILPTTLRERLLSFANLNIKRSKFSEVVIDLDGVELELCTWKQTTHGIWAPGPHNMRAVEYRLARKAAQLTTWAAAKMGASGAPWESLRYSRTFATMIEHDR
ncbi:hypothetical protein OC835_004977 [Tilletia horrida]|nr:hypothetical protein OC835_004977 [Tilletia horrida]